MPTIAPLSDKPATKWKAEGMGYSSLIAFFYFNLLLIMSFHVGKGLPTYCLTRAVGRQPFAASFNQSNPWTLINAVSVYSTPFGKGGLGGFEILDHAPFMDKPPQSTVQDSDQSNLATQARFSRLPRSSSSASNASRDLANPRAFGARSSFKVLATA
jgi:hypothetical protein